MPWMVPETSLGPDQREVIDSISGNWSNSWIKGHAGSGKSVLLIHLVRDYLAKFPNHNVCVVVFTNALQDMVENGLKFLHLKVEVLTIYRFKNGTNKYNAVFCDEVQDIPVVFLEEMKERATTIIVAGDPEQSIYDHDPHYQQVPAEPSDIINILKVKQFPLTIIYRMTLSVLRILGKIFGSILEGRPNVEGDDVEVKIGRAISIEEEIKYVFQESTEINRLRQSETVAIMFPNRDSITEFCNTILAFQNKPPWIETQDRWGKADFSALNAHVARNGLPFMYLGNGIGKLANAERQNKIIIMTYHSAKGLDFSHVFLPMLSQNIWINPDKADVLLFVAISRSKYNLYITYANEMYRPLRKFVEGVEQFDIQLGAAENASDDDDDDFNF
jgi:superfamily I DNA/RNA helicase